MQSLIASDSALGAFIKRAPSFPGFPAPRSADSHFHSLARTIIYQQLAGKAAATIHNRVVALTPGKRFPTADELAHIRTTKLRAAGLSHNKMLAIKALAKSAASGTLKLHSISRQEDESIIDQLTQIRGIGRWSAQMFLMFRLGRLDVLPSGDLGVQEGLRILDKMKSRPKAKELEERGEQWKPLRSVASWYMYRIADEYRAKTIQSKMPQ